MSAAGTFRDRVRELLDRARTLSSDRLAESSVELARLVGSEAERRTDPAEERRARALGSRLRRREGTLFSTLLTDRVHRSTDARRLVEVVEGAAELFPSLDFLPWLDRVELGGLRIFGRLVPELVAYAVRERILREASPYLIDATPEEQRVHLARKRDAGFRVNLNYLGEETLGEGQAARHVEEYRALLARTDVDAVSLKLSNVFSQGHVVAFDATVERMVERLLPLLAPAAGSARERLVYFDMESFASFELTIAVFERLALDRRLDRLRLGVAVQAYLPDSTAAVERLERVAGARAARAAAPIRVRLVKGANLAFERVEASLHRWEVPVFGTKVEVDAHYVRLLERLTLPRDGLELGVASHNLFDLCHALVLREQRGAVDRVGLEMLEGMSDPLARVLTEIASGVLLYTPTVLPEHFSSGVSYLVRRLDENSSDDNFLRHAFTMRVGDAHFERERLRFVASVEGARAEPPPTRRTQDRAAEERRGLARAKAFETGVVEGGAARTEPRAGFDNAPDTDFTREKNRAWLARHLAWARETTHFVRPGVGAVDFDGPASPGFDPSRPGIEPYRVVLAGAEQIELALETALRARRAWGARSTSERAACLERIADGLEARRGRLIALLVLDAGKRVLEADVEVSEAVDFARYYAHSLRAWDEEFELEPLGTVVVTPPWNFALAIPAGGVLAALAAGNTVILKPAPETPLVARALAEVIWEAGVPREVLSFVPCADEDASPLVVDERVSAVILTGATATARAFLRMRPGLRLFAETGGKNGAYVSAVADREQAILHVVQSAFGHAGQKCSALSFLVLEREVYESASFRADLADAAASAIVGSAWNADSFVTPLVQPPRGPLAWALETLEAGEKWLLRPRVDPENPRLVSPAIRFGTRAGGRAHREEFFGPVLAVLAADDLDHGLSILNGTDYGLTAGFFGLDEREQARFLARMDAGNLYVNRPITGAVVGRQPFGGRKASGFGPGAKAGGPGYVAQFATLVPRPRASVVGERAAPRDSSEFGGLLDRAELDELARRRADYARSLADEFAREHVGTRVLGEENVWRFEPARVAVLVGADAAPLDVASTFVALDLAGCASAWFFQREAEAERFLPRALRSTRVVVEHSWPSFSGADFRRLDVNRVRVLGALPAEALGLRAEFEIASDPVSPRGRVELRRYFLERAESRVLHRAGNLAALEVARGAASRAAR